MTLGSRASLGGLLARFTPRERLLLAVLAGLLLLLAVVWFAFLPGLKAVSVAESRRARAATELATIAGLALELKAAKEIAAVMPPEAAANAIGEAALSHGVQILSTNREGDDLRIAADGPGSARMLDWVEDAAKRTSMGVGSMTLSRGESGALMAEVLFSRSGP